MRKIFTFIVALATLSTAVAQHDAEYNLIQRSFNIHEDGSIDYRFHKELTLHANRAMTAYATNGETFITYNPAIETLTINSCYFVRPDGTVVTTPDNAFINQLPEGCADCATHNAMREMAIVHTGLELEGTIVLDYTIHSHSPFLMEHIILAEDYPVHRYEVTIQAEGRLQYLVQPENLDRVQHNAYGDKGAFHLTAYDLPKRHVAPYLPHDEVLYPHLYISNLTVESLNSTLPQSSSTLPAAATLLSSLKQDTPLATATAIRDWVLDFVTPTTLPHRLSLPTSANPEQTFANNCGTPEERCLLLQALLRSAGLHANIEWGFDMLQPYENASFALFNMGATRLSLVVDGVTYLISPLSHRPIEPEKTAAAPQQINVERTLAFQADTVAPHVLRLTLPTEAEALNLDLGLVTPFRTAPLQAKATDETYHYSLPLPEGARLLKKKTSQRLSFPGLGEVEVLISQNGTTVDIRRRLTLQQSIISPDQMADFYQMIYLWSTTNKIDIRL